MKRLRERFASAAARPASRALRPVFVVAGSLVIGVRLVIAAFDEGGLEGVLGAALVLVATAVLGVAVRSAAPALGASLPSETRAPAAVIGVVTTVAGAYVVGAPVLAAIERRGGPLWAAVVLLAATVMVVRRFRRVAPSDASPATSSASSASTALLQCRGVEFGYGKVQVLHGVDFDVDAGELVALLGVNGAGKSTLLRAISGLGLPTAGSIRFAGEDITYLDAESRLRRGINQVPGGRAVFGPLTVIDNLRAYAYSIDRRSADAAIERALGAFPVLDDRRNQAASTLSGGEQQMLALAKAVMLRPRLLLIDELSLGLAPIIVGPMLDLVREINAEGTAVVLVEQSVNIALNLAEHAYFMERGAVQFDGPSRELLDRDDLLRAVFLDGAGKRA